MADADHSTAQSIYAQMLRTSIAPRLRSLGFKGSGARYILPDADRWLMVAFQKGKNSRSDWLNFTVNLTAADKAGWADARVAESWLPRQPSGNSIYPVEQSAVIRLGNLMPSGDDRWWELAPGRPTMLAVIEVLDAIEHAAIPWLRAQFAHGPTSTRDIQQR